MHQMNTRLKYFRLLSACLLVFVSSILFHFHTPDASSSVQDSPLLQHKLYSIQPVKETLAIATESFTASVPQVISLRTQQQLQQQTQGKNQVLHGLHPKHTARPRQANKVTTTFCRKNTFPVDYFIYFLQEIII